jgi:CBS domain-containing protein
VYSKVLAIALPMLHQYMASPPAYAMVGMAAVLAASVRAPLTSILLLFELTHDYRIVLPLMAAVGLSIWLIDHLHPQVVIDNSREPKTAPEPPEPSETLEITVAEAMHMKPLQLYGSLTVAEAGQTLIDQRSRSALVMEDNQELLGIITLQDINRLLSRSKTETESTTLLNQPIAQICTTKILFAHADELLTDAIGWRHAVFSNFQS